MLLLFKGFFLLTSLPLLASPYSLLGALSREDGSLEFLSVEILGKAVVTEARLDCKRRLVGRGHGLRLLWNYATSVFGTHQDVLIHALIFLVKVAELV